LTGENGPRRALPRRQRRHKCHRYSRQAISGERHRSFGQHRLLSHRSRRLATASRRSSAPAIVVFTGNSGFNGNSGGKQ
jgi:hypothetical protein